MQLSERNKVKLKFHKPELIILFANWHQANWQEKNQIKNLVVQYSNKNYLHDYTICDTCPESLAYCQAVYDFLTKQKNKKE